MSCEYKRITARSFSGKFFFYNEANKQRQRRMSLAIEKTAGYDD